MNRLFLAAAAALIATPALAGPTCEGDAPMLPMQQIEDAFVAQGGRVKLIKETDDGCYEIYGWEADGSRVEIYYDPRTGEELERHD